MRLLVLSFGLLTLLPSYGRLGETDAELRTRYGDPIVQSAEPTQVIFRKAGLIIRAGLDQNGRCDYLAFHKDRAKDAPPIPIGIEERAVLLDANANGEVWTRGKVAIADTFSTPSGRYAIHYSSTQVLLVFTPDGLKRYKEISKALTREALKDF